MSSGLWLQLFPCPPGGNEMRSGQGCAQTRSKGGARAGCKSMSWIPKVSWWSKCWPLSLNELASKISIINWQKLHKTKITKAPWQTFRMSFNPQGANKDKRCCLLTDKIDSPIKTQKNLKDGTQMSASFFTRHTHTWLRKQEERCCDTLHFPPHLKFATNH